MQVALDPAEEIPHIDWLRATPGAYEWWYFDAISDDREYAFTTIWFLGNPFSPYYRAASLGRPADPMDHNALFFALYRHGRLHAYHFSRFAVDEINADSGTPLRLQFGPSLLAQQASTYRMRLDDTNANRRRLRAAIDFTALCAPPTPEARREKDAEHIWHPAAPSCRVAGHLAMTSVNSAPEEITLNGTGYHDHNRGVLPFEPGVREWCWARIALPGERTLVIYHTHLGSGEWKTDVLLFESGVLTIHDDRGRCRLGRRSVNAFGVRYAASLSVEGQGIRASVRFRERLDSAPFYLRLLCDAEVSLGDEAHFGYGIGEYFRPRGMDWAITASAMKARIVEQ